VSALAVNGPTAVVDLMGMSQTIGAPYLQQYFAGARRDDPKHPDHRRPNADLTSTAGGIFAGNITGNLAFTRSGTSITLFTGAQRLYRRHDRSWRRLAIGAIRARSSTRPTSRCNTEPLVCRTVAQGVRNRP